VTKLVTTAQSSSVFFSKKTRRDKNRHLLVTKIVTSSCVFTAYTPKHAVFACDDNRHKWHAACIIHGRDAAMPQEGPIMIDTIKRLRNETAACWDLAVDTAGIADCGDRHDQDNEDRAADARDSAMASWDEAVAALENGDVDAAREALDGARRLASEWGDSSAELEALAMLDEGEEEEEEPSEQSH